MKVKEILKSKGAQVWSVKATNTIEEAINLLVEHRIGGLLVHGQKENIVGIITERDIVWATKEYKDKLSKTPVAKVMTQKVIIGTPEDDLDYIMNIMTNHRLRHVPVVENEQLCGIISIGDVVKALLHESQVQIKYLQDYMHGG